MSAELLSAQTLLVVMLLGLGAYGLLGGADFGAGFWHLFAGRGRRAGRMRSLVEHSIGPVWEANHVWLIFVLVLFWTGFPSVFAAVMSTLYIPLTLVALGIIFRGAAFAFRKSSVEPWQHTVYGATFAIASVVTPFFLGTIGGAVASGRVPAGIAAGHLLSSWWNPTSAVCGLLAVGVTAYLAAVYLTADARRNNEGDLAEAFRTRAIGTGIAVGGVAVAGLVVVRLDAPALWQGLSQDGPTAVLASVLTGVISLALLVARRYVLVRASAALAVLSLLSAWAAAQWPYLLPGVRFGEAAATPAVITATLLALAVGAVLLLPSLAALYVTFQRAPADGGPEEAPE